VLEISPTIWVDNIIRGPKMMLYDLNGLCKFAKVSFEDVGLLYDRVYGRGTEGMEKDGLDVEELKQITQQVQLLGRKIDNRLGFTNEDDMLPAECFKPYPGSNVKNFMTREFFDKVREGVYEKYGEIGLE